MVRFSPSENVTTSHLNNLSETSKRSLMTLAWLESGVPALIFVLNLYIFIPSRLRGLPRNYPPVIRWRLLSALMSCILSTLWSIYVLNRHGITELSQWMAYMGLSWVNINFKAWIYSLLLTATLFLGPIYADWVEGDARLLDELRSHNWLTFRNYIGVFIHHASHSIVDILITLGADCRRVGISGVYIDSTTARSRCKLTAHLFIASLLWRMYLIPYTSGPSTYAW